MNTPDDDPPRTALVSASGADTPLGRALARHLMRSPVPPTPVPPAPDARAQTEDPTDQETPAP